MSIQQGMVYFQQELEMLNIWIIPIIQNTMKTTPKKEDGYTKLGTTNIAKKKGAKVGSQTNYSGELIKIIV